MTFLAKAKEFYPKCNVAGNSHYIFESVKGTITERANDICYAAMKAYCPKGIKMWDTPCIGIRKARVYMNQHTQKPPKKDYPLKDYEKDAVAYMKFIAQESMFKDVFLNAKQFNRALKEGFNLNTSLDTSFIMAGITALREFHEYKGHLATWILMQKEGFSKQQSLFISSYFKAIVDEKREVSFYEATKGGHGFLPYTMSFADAKAFLAGKLVNFKKSVPMKKKSGSWRVNDLFTLNHADDTRDFWEVKGKQTGVGWERRRIYSYDDFRAFFERVEK